MRITFVAPRSWPSVGGAEAFLRHLTRALARRHDVRVLALSVGNEAPHRLWESLLPPAPFEAFDDEGVHVEHLRLPPARRTLLAPLAAQVVPGLRRYAYGRVRIANAELYARTVAPLIARAAAGSDVVHMWGTGLLGAATVRAARRLGLASAITPFAHRGQWGDDRASARTYRAADRTIALLDADAQLYRELGVGRVSVCGVCSPGVLAGGGADLRRRHGIDGPLVLFLGVRRPYKGYDLVLDAAARVPEARFAFVGPGPPLVEAGAGVLDVGAVDDAERAAWLDAADLLCLPSEAEIFPSSILEAWSVGTPVLTSEIPPLRELVAATGGGVTCPRDADAIAGCIRTLTRSPSLLAALGLAGRRAWASRFTPETVAGLHEAVYAELAAEDARAA